MPCKHYTGMNKICQWPKRKEKITYRALVVALNKNSNFLPFFPDFFSKWRLFPGLEKFWSNFKTFSRIQDSVRTLEQLWSLETIQGLTITALGIYNSSRNFQPSENFYSHCRCDLLWFWNERRIGESRNSTKWVGYQSNKTKRTHSLQASLHYSNSFRGYVLLIPIT